MPKCSDAKKLKKIRDRVSDMVRNHGEAIKKNAFIHMSACTITEAQWLIKELDRLLDGADVEVPEPEEAVA